MAQHVFNKQEVTNALASMPKIIKDDASFDLIILLKDMYKAFHAKAYKPGTTHVYANLTNRFGKHSNIPGGNDKVMSIGQQAYVKQFMVRRFAIFFATPLEEVVATYKNVIGNVLGVGTDGVDTSHIEALHELGFVPLRIKAIKEGTMVPYGIPTMTVQNTVSGFGWLVNMLETVMSSEIWNAQTAATTAYHYKKNFIRAAIATGMGVDMVPFLGHDFSYRGDNTTSGAAASGFGHLSCFAGSDTIPAGLFAQRYYNVSFGAGDLIMASVNATEHSVMCSYGNEGEMSSIEHLMTNVAPKGILSIVCDTWDFWQVVTEYLPELKDKIMERDGTLVIRPDSGDPVEIICGVKVADEGQPVHGYGAVRRGDKIYRVVELDNNSDSFDWILGDEVTEAECKGLVQCLWEIFGGTETEEGYKLLDSHIGAIYGDSITLQRQEQIIEQLMAKGFCPSVVLGIGSFTYQYVTRDTHGSAVKATAIRVNDGPWEAIFKQPKTDSSKNSAKGLMAVFRKPSGGLFVLQGVDELDEMQGELITIFEDSVQHNETSLPEIRDYVDSQIEWELKVEAA